MALQFPANPVNGQSYSFEGAVYRFSDARGYWVKETDATAVTLLQRTSFVASADQTIYTVDYDPDSAVQVIMNGINLAPTDFTSTDGSSIVFTEPLSANDEIQILFYPPAVIKYGPAATVSDTAPTNVKDGELWFDSSTAKIMVNYNDGNSNQWVEPSYGTVDELGDISQLTDNTGLLGGGTDVYATLAELPLTGNDAGDQAFVSENNRLYLWNGSGWYNIALINTAPTITDGGAGSYELATDGTPTVITLVAEDPEELPITWSYSVTSGTLGGTTVSQADNEFTITPSTDEVDQGEFTITFTASDGVNIATDVSTFALLFTLPGWKNSIASLSASDHTTTNAVYVDRSPNSYSAYHEYGPQQQSFNPYLTNWSADFPYNNGLITDHHSGFDFGTGDFTVEFFVNFRSVSGSAALVGTYGNDGAGGWSIQYNVDSGQTFTVSNGSTVLVNISWAPVLGRWYHVSVSRQSGTIYCAIDGQQIGSPVSDSTDFTYTNQLTIGRLNHSSTTNYLSGLISNLRIVKGTALQTYNFSVPSSKLSAVPGTEFLGLQDSRFIDNSSNSGYIRSYFTTNTVKCVAFNPFNQPTEFVDGQNIGSMYTDSAGTGVFVSHTNSIGTGDFTIELWLYPTVEPSNYDVIISSYHFYSAGYNGNWALRPNNNKLEFGAFNGTSQIGYVSFPMTVQTEFKKLTHQWNHIVLIRKSGTLYLYLNGEKSTTSQSYTASLETNVLNVASYTYNSGINVKGYYSDVKLTRSAVYDASSLSSLTVPSSPIGNTNAEVYLPMDNASMYDKTCNLIPYRYQGTSSTNSVKKYAEASLNVTGGTARTYTFLPTFLTEKFTVEFWAYPTETGDNDYPLTIGDYSTTYGLTVLWQNSAFAMAHFNAGSTTFLWTGNASSTVALNTWHHVAITYDGTTIRLFVNGTLEDSSNTNTVNLAGATLVEIGTLTYSSNYYAFNGYLENIQIINDVCKYTTNFTVPSEEQGITYQAES